MRPLMRCSATQWNASPEGKCTFIVYFLYPLIGFMTDNGC